MKKIWKQKIFFNGLKSFLFFFFLLNITYIFVDFSIHSSKLGKLSLLQLFTYYLSEIVFSYEIFIPLSFLFAIITVLFNMNRHRELVAFQIAGLSKIKILAPVFLLTILISIFSFVNENYLIPASSKDNEAFQDTAIKAKQASRSIQSIRLKDKSYLIYLHFSKDDNEVREVFLIRSFSDIWRINTLKIGTPFIGKNVEHFTRDDSYNLIKKDSFAIYEFSDLKVDARSFQEAFIPYESRSFYSLISHKFFASKEEALSIKTMLHYKAIMVFLPFIIFLTIPPFCMKYSRSFSILKVLAISLFAFAAFFAGLNAAVLLCENRVITPFLGCWSIPGFLFILGFFKSIRSYFFLS